MLNTFFFFFFGFIKNFRLMFAISHLSPCNLWFDIFIAQSNNFRLARKYRITMIVLGSLLLAFLTSFIVILVLYIKGWYSKYQFISCLSHSEWKMFEKNEMHIPNLNPLLSTKFRWHYWPCCRKLSSIFYRKSGNQQFWWNKG